MIVPSLMSTVLLAPVVVTATIAGSLYRLPHPRGSWNTDIGDRQSRLGATRERGDGAGDGNRTHDIQLGKLTFYL